VRSRKLSPDFTGKRDFAKSNPIDVPKPPFNFKTTCMQEAVERLSDEEHVHRMTGQSFFLWPYLDRNIRILSLKSEYHLELAKMTTGPL